MRESFTTLISATELMDLQQAGRPLVVFDCSFDLMTPSAGPQQFEQAHIPGAVYANLDTDLSAKHGAPGLVNVEQTVTWAEDGLSWYVAGAHTTSGSYDINGGAVYQLNLSARTYFYFAIG